MRNKRKSVFPNADTVTYVPVQIKQPSRAKRHRLKWSKRLIRKHPLNRIKFVDEEAQARINAEIAAKGSFDEGVAAAAAELRANRALKDPAFGSKGHSSIKKADKAARKAAKKGRKGGKALKVIAILTAILILLAAIGFGVLTALNYFLFIPDADVALRNALKAKFDIGTEFDLTDLEDRGVITFEASDLDELGLAADELKASVSYNGKATALNASIGSHELNAIYNNKNGFALNATEFDGGAYYGVPFEGLSSALEDSFLNPDGESENALSESSYENWLELAKDLEKAAEDGGDYGKYADAVIDAIDGAFEASSLSESEINYGGIKVFDKVRSARCVIYSFDGGDVADFLGRLANSFGKADAELELATDMLLRTVIGDTVENLLGEDLESCEALSEALSELADEMEEGYEDWSAKLVLAYVGRAFTAIQFKLVSEYREIFAEIDFGENPSKDRNIAIKVEIANSDASNYSFAANYGVAENDSKSLVTLTYSHEYSGDVPVEIHGKTAYEYYLTINKSSGKATLEGFMETETPIENAKPVVHTEDLYEIEFKLDDSKSSLGITLESITLADDVKIELPGTYKLTLATQRGSIKLPEYKNALDMDSEDASALCDELEEYLEEFLDDTLGEDANILELISTLVGMSDITIPDGDQSGDEQPDGEQENDGDLALESGYYTYEDGSGYKEVYFFNSGNYMHKCYDGDELLSEERGTYEVYRGTITLESSDGEIYEVLAEYDETGNLSLDGLTYHRD